MGARAEGDRERCLQASEELEIAAGLPQYLGLRDSSQGPGRRARRAGARVVRFRKSDTERQAAGPLPVSMRKRTLLIATTIALPESLARRCHCHCPQTVLRGR